MHQRLIRVSLCFAVLLTVALLFAGHPFARQRVTGPGTGVIRGRVELPAIATLVPRPNIADAGAAEHHAHETPQQAVVYLEGGPRGAVAETEPRHATLDQRDETFEPHVLAITAGTTVDFPNSDRIYHNVFSLSPVKRFDLGRYAAGKSRSIRFDKPGIVRVFCEIHSHMSAFILVFNHPFFALTDNDGRYRIDGVPAGTYNVAAWNERASFESRSVTVADGGSTQLDFAPK